MFNPCGFSIGSPESLPIEGSEVTRVSCMQAGFPNRPENLQNKDLVDSDDSDIAVLREQLREEATDLCRADTPLPPLRAINHRIDLIDENKTY